MTTLRNFPVVGLRGDESTVNSWNVTHPNEVELFLDREGRTVIRPATATSIYLVLGGDARNFKKLGSASSIPTDTECAFNIYLNVEAGPSVKVEVHLLEYGSDGERLGVAQLPAGQRMVYVPPRNVTDVLLTVRVRGAAPVAINSIEMKQIARPSGLADGVKTIAFEKIASARSEASRDFSNVKESIDRLIAAGQRARRAVSEAQTAVIAASEPESDQIAGSSLSARRLTRELLIQLASTLPESNGSEYYSEKLPYRLAIITDEYMYNFYRDAFEEVVYVRPENAREVTARGFDVLLYVTCWKGMHDEEWRGVKFREAPASALEQLLNYARKNGKPTLFQSIEDPSNFDYFLPIAEKFDYIFTSDVDCVEKYVEAVGHDRVFYGEYGANPLLNNPIGSHRHTIDKAFFAGSYPKRYQDRVADMHVLFDSVLSTGENLTLVDRNFGDPEYAFPAEYGQFILEPMPHEVLQRVHKLFRWSLNFNSIKSSPTMCAMRVYELQAQGRGLISNYARSVFNRFPEVRIVAEKEELDSYFGGDINLEELRNNETQVRNIMTGRTAPEISAQMLCAAGLETASSRALPVVALIAETIDDALKSQIDAQTYPNVVLLSSAEASATELDGREVRYVGHVDTRFDYGINYVTDRVNAFKYTDSAFVTQVGHVNGGKVVGTPHEYVAAPRDGLTIYSVKKIGPNGLSTLLSRRTIDREVNGYGLPPFEALERRGDSPAASVVVASYNPSLSVIVPVFNAGEFLVTKCIPSIDRNTRAGEFEIVLVDDGSTDGMTPDICRRLAANDPRVKVHCFETGGSGSASRPRNWGIDNASAARIAFLDPDNEISDAGYDKLLALLDVAQANDPEVAFVSGYQAKVTQRTTTTGRHTNDALTIYPDLRAQYFDRGKFPVVSTQAAVIERRLFADGDLRFVELAAGQDTLFGWELLLKAGHGAFTSDAHLIYYAERDGSVTNSVDVRYFEKKLIMEVAQVGALERHGLLESYREHHFKNFLDNWYKPKLEAVADQDRPVARDLLLQIVALYGMDADL